MASSTVRAAVLHGARDMRLESRVLPPPAADEVQVRVLATGLCGSDLHYYNHFRNGDIVVLEPLTLGHESVGEVVAQGWSQTETATDPSSRPGGHKLKVGDFVALEVGKPCEVCDLCTSGRYNICPLMRFRSSAKGGAPHAQGTLQERINMPARWCHPLPFSAASVSSSTSAAGLSEALSPTVSLDVGALIEPLAVAVHARSRAECAGAGRAQTALVFGAGAVGLLCCAVNKAAPAVRTVVVADIQAERVQFALDRGLADVGVVVPMRRPETVEEKLEFAREVAGLVKGAKGDTAIGDIGLVYECTGVETCLQAAIYATAPGGKIMLIGMGNPVQTLPISAAALREVDLIGVFRYAAGAYQDAIRLLLSPTKDGSGNRRLPDISGLVTHRFRGMDAIGDAFAMAARVKDDEGNLVIKVVVDMS